jgi:membrane protease subunit HflC
MRPDASALGLAIEDVRIRRTDLTKEVSDQTFERMKAERLAEAELIRARGNEGAQRIRAVADRQVVEIESEANRESEILRGEGDAERNRTFAEAFNQDPNFFEFYRSMQAYSQALQNSGTTMVLSPDSDFFRYFNDPMGAPRSAPGGTAAPAAGATGQ